MICKTLDEVLKVSLSPFDLLPQQDMREKLVGLLLQGVPEHIRQQGRIVLSRLHETLVAADVSGVNVVVFGGGTGLSNIIGGDSRAPGWPQRPFAGLKELFPQTRSVVCVTDNGGSTGELLKDLPLVAIGDMRHVLLSSVQLSRLQQKYKLTRHEAVQLAGSLATMFNWRLEGPLFAEHPGLQDISRCIEQMPHGLVGYFQHLIHFLFKDSRLAATLQRSHCFGNLLLVAAVYRELDASLSNEELAENAEHLHQAIRRGMDALGRVIGAADYAVLPCTSTPAQLRVSYANGVEIPGEHKLSSAQRGVPVAGVAVEYCGDVAVYDEVVQDILKADIIVLAPGSLYSSIIPVFKVPRLAEAVRANKRALKVLVSNLWVQDGETDLSLADPQRKFYVSDMIRAYEKNIPGGTGGLFNEVICIGLHDIPGSVLQNYAVEDKIPIYLDREILAAKGYFPIECSIYSREALAQRGVIQHDPDMLALAIKALFCARDCSGGGSEGECERDQSNDVSVGSGPPDACLPDKDEDLLPGVLFRPGDKLSSVLRPFQKYRKLQDRIEKLQLRCVGHKPCFDEAELRRQLTEILWDHPLIPLAHLDYIAGIDCVDPAEWRRDQRWDNVFSFFDPQDKCIRIRGDQFAVRQRLEVGLLIAIGESLLGNYALKKEMSDVCADGVTLGRVYHLSLCSEDQRDCWFSSDQLREFLLLARMRETDDPCHYIRLVNRGEGFTPPGLLMGLLYAWYIDNRFATHIEYKMSVMKISRTDLIPEQLRMVKRRQQMVGFFKDVVFR